MSRSANVLSLTPTPSRKPQKPSHRVRTQSQELTPEQSSNIREVFEIFDANHDGALTHPQFQAAMCALGFDVHNKDVTTLISNHDEKSRGLICRVDFEAVLNEKISTRDPLKQMRKDFDLFDEGGTGRISLRDLVRSAKEPYNTIDDSELSAMIEEFDLDKDGRISFHEYIAISRGER